MLLLAQSGAVLSGLALLLLTLRGILCAQNVGVGTSNPFDKLRVTSLIRSDARGSTDTTAVLSNLISLDCGGLFTTTGSVTLRIDPQLDGAARDADDLRPAHELR